METKGGETLKRNLCFWSVGEVVGAHWTEGFKRILCLLNIPEWKP